MDWIKNHGIAWCLCTLNICEWLERFWDISCNTSDQLVNTRAAQIERDTIDVEKRETEARP